MTLAGEELFLEPDSAGFSRIPSIARIRDEPENALFHTLLSESQLIDFQSLLKHILMVFARGQCNRRGWKGARRRLVAGGRMKMKMKMKKKMKRFRGDASEWDACLLFLPSCDFIWLPTGLGEWSRPCAPLSLRFCCFRRSCR